MVRMLALAECSSHVSWELAVARALALVLPPLRARPSIWLVASPTLVGHASDMHSGCGVGSASSSTKASTTRDERAWLGVDTDRSAVILITATVRALALVLISAAVRALAL
jgi:hypothetical protein